MDVPFSVELKLKKDKVLRRNALRHSPKPESSAVIAGCSISAYHYLSSMTFVALVFPMVLCAWCQ